MRQTERGSVKRKMNIVIPREGDRAAYREAINCERVGVKAEQREMNRLIWGGKPDGENEGEKFQTDREGGRCREENRCSEWCREGYKFRDRGGVII